MMVIPGSLNFGAATGDSNGGVSGTLRFGGRPK